MEAMGTTSGVERSKKPNLDDLLAPAPAAAAAVLEITESSSSSNDEEEEEEEEDRLSKLPEEILDLILSFLHTTQVIKTSLLSTRWRNLWKSHPYIQLYDCPKYSKTSIYVDHLLRLRNSNASNIKKFRLDCYDEPNNLDRFHQCVVAAAVNHRAEEVDIMVWPSSSNSNSTTHSSELNPSIFTSGVVRVFKFAGFRNKISMIRFPRSICYATHLRFLKLYGITLPLGDSKNQELHLICPNLEKLIIKDCHHSHIRVLDISAPQLHKLVIFNPFYCSDDTSLGKCILGIHTPKLSSFRYYGSSYVDYSFLEKFPFLDNVDITLTALALAAASSDENRYIKLLNGLWNVKNLSIEGYVEIFSLTKEIHLNSFTCLKNLKLRSTHEMSSIQGMIYLLLNGCGLVESFEWEVCKQYRSAEEKTVEEYIKLPEFKLGCLKLIKVGTLQGHRNELEFLKFLVKSAVVLENMIIYTGDSFMSVEQVENRRQFNQAVIDLPWSSPTTIGISKYQAVITLVKDQVMK